MRHIFLLGLLVLLTTGFIQEEKLVFKNFTAANGLSQHDVNCIIQDDDGFLWFGTNDGLNKYDGYNFTIFKPLKNSNSSVSGRIIQDITSDPYGNLWIASLDGGLNRYNSESETFDNFNSKLAHLGSYANDVKISNDSILWVQFRTKTCYAILHENVDEMVFHTLSPEELDGNKDDFNKSILMKEGEIYYSSPSVLYRLDYTKSKEGLQDIKFLPSKNSNFITQIRTPYGIKWELYNNKLVYTGKGGTTITKHINNLSSSYSAVDRSGQLWCVINDKLSMVYIEKEKLRYKSIDFESLDFLRLKNNSVKSIYVDNTGNLWVGTNGGGIYKKTNSNYNFNHFNKNRYGNSLSSNKIRSLLEDQFGNLWVGTEGGGVNFLSNNHTNYEHFNSFTISKSKKGISSKNVFSITENILNENNSILWFSTENGGLNKLLINRYDKIDNFHFEKFNQPTDDGKNIKYQAIHSILSEGKNRLWIGYYGKGLGLAEWKNPSEKPVFSIINPVNKNTQLSGKIIRDIYRDSFGILWITTNNGLNKLNENSNDITQSTFKSYQFDPNDETSIGSNYTLQIFESSNNTIWIGTIGGGLNKMLRHKDGSVIGFKRYNQQNKLFPDDVINSIQEDDDGALWVGTNTGLIKFNPQSETYDTYSQNELQNPEMSEISALKRRTGELVFGGINGINVFTPNFVKKENALPKSIITDLSIMYEPVKPLDTINNKTILTRSITHTDQITLDADINNFSFSFSSLHYNDPKLNKYKYILEGFDQNWIETTSDLRIANYTNIKPGNYTFKVFGSNNNGEWSKKPAQVNITILPPWYLTDWAILLYFICFIVVLLLLKRYTVIDIKRKRKLEYDRLEKEKEKEINKVKLEFFTNISHELRSPLTLILGPAEKLVSQVDTLQKEERLRLYKTMQRNSDYLLKLIKQLLDFRKLEQGKMKLRCTHINLTVIIDKIIEQFYSLADEKKVILNHCYPAEKLFAWIDINIIEKILHNLLSNALKFTPKGGNISLDITIMPQSMSNYPDGHIEIKVTDSGKGIKPSDLQNIFNRFYQSDNQNKENEGVGIGLSFSQNLAKLHSGEIRVTSEYQKGTCFTLFLPLGNSHLSSEQMVDDKQIIVSKIDTATNILKKQNDVMEYKNGDKPVLLIIEDNPEINHYLASELSPYYTTISSMDGKKGLEIAFEKYPNIIISDIMMPGMNGIEVCKKAKNDIRTSHIPFILLSAKTNDESKIEGLHSGADVYLTKPFNMEVLKTQILSLLKNRKKIHMDFKNPNLEPPKIEISSIDDQFIKNIITIIEENIDNPKFTVQKFSDLSGMSRTTFFNKMKSLTGLKPTEFLRNYRLKLAVQYLEKGLSVKECMYKTGFNTPSYFTQSFKVLFKMTPTEYINKL